MDQQPSLKNTLTTPASAKTAKKRRKHGSSGSETTRPPLASFTTAQENVNVAGPSVTQVSPIASVNTTISSVSSISSAGSSPLVLPSGDDKDPTLSSPTPPSTPDRDPKYAYSDENENLPFASRKKNSEFHQIFKDIPNDDWLLEDFSCALQDSILLQGRLYVSERYICFYCNILGYTKHISIPYNDIDSIERKNIAVVIPNSIQIKTISGHTYFFASFLFREYAFSLLHRIWGRHSPKAFKFPSKHVAQLKEGSTSDGGSDFSPSVYNSPHELSSDAKSKDGSHARAHTIGHPQEQSQLSTPTHHEHHHHKHHHKHHHHKHHGHKNHDGISTPSSSPTDTDSNRAKNIIMNSYTEGSGLSSKQPHRARTRADTDATGNVWDRSFWTMPRSSSTGQLIRPEGLPSNDSVTDPLSQSENAQTIRKGKDGRKVTSSPSTPSDLKHYQLPIPQQQGGQQRVGSKNDVLDIHVSRGSGGGRPSRTASAPLSTFPNFLEGEERVTFESPRGTDAAEIGWDAPLSQSVNVLKRVASKVLLTGMEMSGLATSGSNEGEGVGVDVADQMRPLAPPPIVESPISVDAAKTFANEQKSTEAKTESETDSSQKVSNGKKTVTIISPTADDVISEPCHCLNEIHAPNAATGWTNVLDTVVTGPHAQILKFWNIMYLPSTNTRYSMIDFLTKKRKCWGMKFSEWSVSAPDNNDQLNGTEDSNGKPTSRKFSTTSELSLSKFSSQPPTKDLSRTTEFTTPVNAPIGPKQALAKGVEKILHYTPGKFLCLVTSSQAVNVPAGKDFQSRSCISIYQESPNSVRLVISCQVEFFKSLWIKGIIEKSNTETAKDFNKDFAAWCKEVAHKGFVDGSASSDEELDDGGKKKLKRKGKKSIDSKLGLEMTPSTEALALASAPSTAQRDTQSVFGNLVAAVISWFKSLSTDVRSQPSSSTSNSVVSVGSPLIKANSSLSSPLHSKLMIILVVTVVIWMLLMGLNIVIMYKIRDLTSLLEEYEETMEMLKTQKGGR